MSLRISRLKDSLHPPSKHISCFLPTLGAWLNSAFVVEKEKLKQAGILYHVGSKPDTGFDLLKWRHIETLGREHYVEIVTAGHLLPFGHEGVKITITERKPHKETGTAANFRREIVVVTKPVKYYDYIDPEGRFMNFPFKRIEIMNPSTPLLDDPTAFIPGPSETEQFVIRSGDKDVLFSIRATDQDGKSIDFSMPPGVCLHQRVGELRQPECVSSGIQSDRRIFGTDPYQQPHSGGRSKLHAGAFRCEWSQHIFPRLCHAVWHAIVRIAG